MSEAMTNPEIEDVLASIRRLVAQDRRPRPERLILTEEFRVRQANIPAPPQPQGAPVLTLQPVPSPDGAAPEAEAPASLAQVVAETVRAAQAPVAAPVTPAAAEPVPPATPAPDAAALEASLRDLEAAIPGPPPAAEPPLAQPQPQPQAEIVGDDVAFIDEDDLERMVARIVREELRGQLGERITLQVRKLVRAEIARALDERNLLG